MRLHKITITNMAAFEQFETELPAVALIQGTNGAGKTAFLNCLRYAFGRDVEGKLLGHDADMLHGDAAVGEILIEFDDGGALRCRTSRETNETVRSYRKPGVRKFEVGRKEIDAIANAVSYDALSFMNLAEKDQLTTLLKIMAVAVTPEELKEALGDAIPSTVPVYADMNGFDTIATWFKVLYDSRREYNTASDTHHKHAQELLKALPPPSPTGRDWAAEAQRLEAATHEMVEAENKKIDQVRSLLDAEKEQAESEYASVLQKAEKDRFERLDTARTQANAAVKEIRDHNAPEYDRQRAELAVAHERARAEAAMESTRKAAQTAEAQALKTRAASQQLTEAMDRLNKLRQALATRLPIKDLIIQNGRICRLEAGKMVPFDRWNTASQMAFCLKIAVLAHGEAGLVLCDNTEHFSDNNRQALFDAAQKYAETEGMQIVLATVAEQPLTVTAP